MYDLLKNNVKVEELVKTQERSFPKDPYWDHHSDKYIHSPNDEHEMQIEVDKYNDIINGFKRDLKLQREILDYMQHMKRPHLKGLKGNVQNVYSEV